jgi:hypothetical protein
MKKFIVMFLSVLFITACFASEEVHPIDKDGTRVDPGAVHTARVRWVQIDTSTGSLTMPSDLSTIERTYQAAKTIQAANAGNDGEISFFDIPRSWNTIRLRAMGLTENVSYVTAIYFGTLGDGNRDIDSTSVDAELSLAGNITWTIGAASSTVTGYRMADTVAVATDTWVKAWETDSFGNNRVAEALINLTGADIMVVVPTTAASDSILIGKGY